MKDLAKRSGGASMEGAQRGRWGGSVVHVCGPLLREIGSTARCVARSRGCGPAPHFSIVCRCCQDGPGRRVPGRPPGANTGVSPRPVHRSDRVLRRSLDWQVEYVDKPWDELLVDLEKGEIDLLPAVAVTAGSASIYDYSQDPPFIDSGVVFTGPEFHLEDHLRPAGCAGRRSGGKHLHARFRDLRGLFRCRVRVRAGEDNPSVMQAITDGTVDAGICIYSLGLDLSRQYPVSITAISFAPTALSFAVPKGKNADLIAGIDQLMAPMVNDPDSLYSRSFDKWILPSRADLHPRLDLVGHRRSCFLGLLVALWNIALRRQVAAKTKHLMAEISERERTRGATPPVPEDGGRGPAGRRHRPRLQQPAHRHHRLLRPDPRQGDELRPRPCAATWRRSGAPPSGRAPSPGRSWPSRGARPSSRRSSRLNDVFADMEPLLRRTLGEDIELVTLLDPDLGHERGGSSTSSSRCS